MSDIASLGLAIDSRPVTQATAALNAFQGAANAAAAGADKLQTAAKTTATGTAAVATAGKNTDTALKAVANSSAAAGKAAQDLAGKHASMSTQAMAAQHSIRSLIEAMASGQPISQALGQQLNHLSYAATGPGGITAAFKQATGALIGLINPTTAVVGGVAAATVGLAMFAKSVIDSEKKFDDLSHSVGVGVGQLHALQSAAAFKGIDTEDFAKGMAHFAGSVYQAQHGMGELADVFRANNTTAKSFTDYLEKASDLIKNAGSDQQRLQLLQQMGLPATMDWVRFLSQGKDAIRAATEEATKFDEAAEQKMVASARRFDEAWDKAWKNFSTGAKSGILTALDAMTQLSDKADGLAKTVGNAAFWKNFIPAGTDPTKFGLQSVSTAESRIGGAFSAAAENKPSDFLKQAMEDKARKMNGADNKATVDPNALQHSIALQQQALGIYGQTVTAQEAVKSIELQVQAARLQGVNVDQKRIEVLKRLAVEQTIGTAQIKAQADAEKINGATVGMSVGQAAQYTAVQNALNEAKRNGRELTQDNIASINKEAAALGDAAKRTDNLRFAYDNLVQGPLETFTGAIAQGAKAMDALKQAASSALGSIAKKLADMAAQNLWNAAFGGSGGGLLGGLGSLLGLGGSGGNGNFTMGAAPGGGTMPFAAANGGTFDSGSWGVVGEKGPELIKVNKGSVTVVPNHISKPYLPGFAAGGSLDSNGGVTRLPFEGQSDSGGASHTHVTVGVSVDDQGNLQAYVKDVSTQAVNSFANSPQFPNHVAKATKTARSRRL